MPKEHKRKFEKPKVESSEDFALVTKILGGGRFLLKLNLTNREVVGSLRGKLRHKMYKKTNKAELGKIVSVSFRDFEDKNVDILSVLDDAEVRLLKKQDKLAFLEGEIVLDAGNVPEDTGFCFDDI